MVMDSPEGRATTLKKTVVMAGVCFNVFISLGFMFSIGALFVEMINLYGTSRSEASLVQSLGIGLMFGAGLVTALLIDRLGLRTPLIMGALLSFLGLFSSWFSNSVLYLTVSIGVVTGLGSNLVYMTSSVMVTLTFQKGRRLAMPGLICAGGVGGIVFPKLLEYMLEEYGLRGTLLICSAIVLNIIPSGILISSMSSLPPKKTEDQQSQDKNKVNTWRRKYAFFKNITYVCFMITASCTFGAINTLLVSLVDFAGSRGLSTDTGVQLLLIYNTVNCVSRLGSGLIKLIFKVHGAVIFCCSVVVCSSCLLLLRTATDYSAMVALVSVCGLGFGGIMGIYPFSVLEFVGPEMFPFALGFSGFMNGIASPTGGLLMGYMYDSTGTYDLAYLVNGIVGYSAATLTTTAMLVSMLCKTCERNRIYTVT